MYRSALYPRCMRNDSSQFHIKYKPSMPQELILSNIVEH